LDTTTRAEAGRYTEEADQIGLAQNAFARREEHNAKTSPKRIWSVWGNHRKRQSKRRRKRKTDAPQGIRSLSEILQAIEI
jgi:hypothetical protein